VLVILFDRLDRQAGRQAGEKERLEQSSGGPAQSVTKECYPAESESTASP